MVIGGTERVAGRNPGIGPEHEARAGRNHLPEVVREGGLARRRIRGSRPAAWRERACFGRRANRRHDLRRQRLGGEIVVAHLGAVSEPDHRRPVRLLLPEQGQVLVVQRLAAHGVDEDVDAGAHDGLLIGERGRVRMDLHLVAVRFVDDRGGARLIRCRHFVDGVQRLCAFEEHGVRAAVGRRHAGHEQEA